MKPIAVIGLDRPEYTQIRAALNVPVVAHETLPRIYIEEGRLWIEKF